MKQEITIYEGGVGYSFETSMVKTGLTDEQEAVWIPEAYALSGIVEQDFAKEWSEYDADDQSIYGWAKVILKNPEDTEDTYNTFPITFVNRTVNIKESGIEQIYRDAKYLRMNESNGATVDFLTPEKTNIGPLILTEEKMHDPQYLDLSGHYVFYADQDGYFAYNSIQIRALATGLKVDTKPTKMLVKPGGSVDLTGIVVKAVYSVDEFAGGDETEWICPEFNGGDSDVTDYISYSPTTAPETEGPFNVTISWDRYDDLTTVSTTLTMYSTTLDHISITTPPTTLGYHDDDTIDFTGIVVQTFKEDDSLWTNTDYPDGTIPFNELIFPVTIADFDGDGGGGGGGGDDDPDPGVEPDWEDFAETGGSEYEIGDLIVLDLGDYGKIRMQKVYEGEEGTTSTWVAKDCLPVAHCMDSSGVMNGGFPKSELKSWLNSTIYNAMPSELRGCIKKVKKVTKCFIDGKDYDNYTSTEKIWLPSAREITAGSDTYERKGVYYETNTLWDVDNTRRLKTLGYGGEYTAWWTRSGWGYGDTKGRYVAEDGDFNASYKTSPATELGIAIGFCVKAQG